jgi:transposase
MIRGGTINTIHELSAQGKSIHAIARELGIARNTVRRYLRGKPEASPRGKFTQGLSDFALKDGKFI